MKKFLISIFIANIIVTLLFWWAGSSSLVLAGDTPSLFIAFGRLTGLLAEIFILVQLVLVGRIPFVEKTIGFDKLNAVHRTIGYWLSSTIILHPILLVVGYAYVNDVSFSHQFVTFFTNYEDVANAVFGLMVLIFASILSIKFIRKALAYETWHVFHLGMYVAIVAFFGHQVMNGDLVEGYAFAYWYALNFSVFGFFICYRFIRPFYLFGKHRFFIERVVQETKDVYSVYIGGINLEKFKYDSGQYIHVSFLMKGMWQPHPFSISSAMNGKHIRLSIKSSGDFTERIKNLRVGVKVLLEGPFGKFTENVAVKDKYLFVAGGIGITPIRAMLESLSKKSKDISLLYANKTPLDIALREEIEGLTNNFHHVLSEDGGPEYHKGYVNIDLVQRLVPDFMERDIYICGPVPMMDSVVDFLIKSGVSKPQIHFEKFSY
jgi:predicted ferric reductase